MEDLFEKLLAILGPKGATKDPELIAPHLVEWRGNYQGRTPFMILPKTTHEVAQAARLITQAGQKLTLQGGNTGLVGGQTPQGEILMSLKRLNQIRTIDPGNNSITVEAGVILSNVQDAAHQAGRKFPLSLASQGAATIGGLISTNAGGVHVLRYGTMRELVLGLEVVLADGRILDLLTGLRKDNTGYDLKQAFIGAEGTLGIVTAATLKLFPQLACREVAFVQLSSPQAGIDLLHLVRAETGALSAFEFMNRRSVSYAAKNVETVIDPMPEAEFMALIECESASDSLTSDLEHCLGKAIETGLIQDALIAQSDAQSQDFWCARESISAGHKPEGPQTSHDVSVPTSRIPEFLETAETQAQSIHEGARIVAFGHMGDGNIHFTVIAREGAAADQFPKAKIEDIINQAATSLGGSISAEHGIGRARRNALAQFKDAEALNVMRAMKDMFDPERTLNPSALL